MHITLRACVATCVCRATAAPTYIYIYIETSDQQCVSMAVEVTDDDDDCGALSFLYNFGIFIFVRQKLGREQSSFGAGWYRLHNISLIATQDSIIFSYYFFILLNFVALKWHCIFLMNGPSWSWCTVFTVIETFCEMKNE